MANATSHTTGIIARRLSPRSFITSDPEACVLWLEKLDWVQIPTQRPSEVARLELLGVIAAIFSSGLVVMIDGRAG